MSLKGLDYFLTSPGEKKVVRCRVCGTECNVRRNVNEPTGWMAGIAGRRKRHDRFDCPHAGQPWHERALKLRQAIDDCPSESVRKLMLDDLGFMLQERAL